jgi:RHS repeat-associated protein
LINVWSQDGLLTVAGNQTVGSLTLTRSPQNGIITSTTQQQLNTTHTINAFGEPDVFTLKRGTTVLFVEDVGARDKAGRILDRSEQALNSTTLETKSYGYGYGLTGRLEHVTVNGAQVAEYIYDGNGNRERWTTPTGTVVGRYDAEDRLSRYCPETAAGDPSPDPIMGLPCNSYAYRASGELATKTEIGTGQQTQYDYDELGSLRRVSLPDGRVLDYELDPRGRRIGKKVGGVRQWGLLYQNSNAPAAKLDAANNVVQQYIYATKATVPEFMIRGTGFGFESYRFVTDHLGSVRLVVKTNDGSIAQRIEYDEFGNVTGDTNPGFQPFGYAGGIYDADTGLVRFGARDYDAVTGRWTAKDPILFRSQETNLYTYVRNDPINRFDPKGLVDIFIGFEGDLVGGPIGGESALGIVIDTDHPLESGIFRTGGPAAGGNVGVSVCVGAVVRDVEGFGSDIDANIGQWSPSLIFDDQGVNGASLGYGPGVGVSLAQGYTTTITVQDAINVVGGWFE